MRTRLGIFLAVVMVLCTACGAKAPAAEKDFSGRYTDKQGASEICSELDLRRDEDGGYTVSLSLYRLMALEGTAEEQGGVLHFVSDPSVGFTVEGDIVIDGETAEITITRSDTYLTEPGMVYRFPDGAE